MADLVRIGFMGAISNTVLLLIKLDKALARRVIERQLFSEEDLKRLKQLKDRIEPTTGKDKLEFTLEEYILLYTTVDLCCKMYVSDISEDIQEMNKKVIEQDDATFEEVRDVMLRYNEAIMIDVLIVIGDKTISNYIHELAGFEIDFPIAPDLTLETV